MMEASVCFLLLLSLALQPSDAAGPGSCVGRCGEVFTRGQQCSCDFSCLRHNECCQDFQAACTTDQSCEGRCGETFSRGRVYAGVSGSLSRTAQPLRAAATGNRRPGRGWGDSNSESEEWYSARGPCSRYPRGQCPGSIRQLTASSSGRAPAAPTNQPQQGLLADGTLCSDSPIDGLTALSNGTVLIFKGELLWSVDPVSRSVGGPQRITHTLGVSSPIDTVFTRCNCHAHTYIIKGDQFWRLDGNMVMEPGYPRPLTSEFPGLTGSIRAALAVPATRSSPESVYFFKSGDIMQRFSFPAGSAPSCSNTPSTAPKTRFTLQAGLLGAEVNIRVSLKGFPSPVTSALSQPRPQRGGLFEHYVFSGPLFFSVHISGDLLVLTAPPAPAAPAPPPILSPVVYSDFANMAAQNANTPPPS
ncbi:proteoglycan 4-like isoform X2 [Gymnodraco acuticeps]|uniref:Proteoglycan 4-like isoform X2 n=1 Tax=Gymnodraco acuticeps TaxID=8218 RepID=A0A6P8U3A0_GYMAC|nr:proteoglycan 4-like isoform X2 [Gymnodraco acuticeps]